MKAQIRVIGSTLLLFVVVQMLHIVTCEAQIQEMSNEELALESTSIVYGTCTHMESAWTENNEMIFTTITVVPEHYLKGNMESEINITVPGGQVGDIVYEVSEMPVFQKGEEVFAFIWKHPSGLNLITGGSQGKMKIEKDAKTGKKTVRGRGQGKGFSAQTGQESIQANNKTKAPKSKSNKVPLDDFTKEVEGYLNKH
jgi:hypothetical protein